MSEVSAPSMLSPKVLIPFMLTGTIWGSTWFVITGQISDVPAAWGVFYRFMLATPALFALAVVMGNRLRLNRPEHLLALGVGIAQFSGNFLFVYNAESHITSGIVAVMFALLMVPNAIFARVFIGERVQGGFIGGSLVAIAGVAMLLVHEWNAAPLGGNVGLGIVLAVGGMLAASIANVVQANPTGRGVPMVSFLAWAMVYGTAFDLAGTGRASPASWPSSTQSALPAGGARSGANRSGGTNWPAGGALPISGAPPSTPFRSWIAF